MPPEPTSFTLRPAQVGDATAVAALHVKSWRATYRGSLSDAYLDGPIEGERQAFWRERLRHPRPDVATILLEEAGGALIGFVCLLPGHDREWGTLIDNLHVDPARKGEGLGRVLMRAAGDHLLYALSRPPVHLFVLDANHAAMGFYRRLGGEAVETMVKTEPDGSQLPIIRIAWRSLAAFVEGVG